MIEISELTEADEETLSSVNHLLPQLSGSASLITLDRLQVLACSECTRLYLAKEGDHIHGMLSLVVFGIPTGTKAWVEGVVVDDGARGKGVGKALMRHAMEQAKKLGAKTVDLTSRPSRKPPTSSTSLLASKLAKPTFTGTWVDKFPSNFFPSLISSHKKVTHLTKPFVVEKITPEEFNSKHRIDSITNQPTQL